MNGVEMLERVFITGKFEIKKNGSIEMKNPYIEINDYNFEEDNISFIPIYAKVRNNSPSWIRKKFFARVGTWSWP